MSDDGTTWHGFMASETGLAQGDGVLFPGTPSHLWTPEEGLHVETYRK